MKLIKGTSEEKFSKLSKKLQDFNQMSLQPYSCSSSHKTQNPIDFVANTNQVGFFSKDNLEVLWDKEIAYNSFFLSKT